MIDRKFLPFSGNSCCGDKESHSNSSTKKAGCGCSGNNQMTSPSPNVTPFEGTSWGPGVLDLSRAVSPYIIDYGGGDKSPTNWKTCNDTICCSYFYDWSVALNRWVLNMTCWRIAGAGLPEWHFII